jgi:hypothetical protein
MACCAIGRKAAPLSPAGKSTAAAGRETTARSRRLTAALDQRAPRRALPGVALPHIPPWRPSVSAMIGFSAAFSYQHWTVNRHVRGRKRARTRFSCRRRRDDEGEPISSARQRGDRIAFSQREKFEPLTAAPGQNASCRTAAGLAAPLSKPDAMAHESQPPA